MTFWACQDLGAWDSCSATCIWRPVPGQEHTPSSGSEWAPAERRVMGELVLRQQTETFGGAGGAHGCMKSPPRARPGLGPVEVAGTSERGLKGPGPVVGSGR